MKNSHLRKDETFYLVCSETYTSNKKQVQCTEYTSGHAGTLQGKKISDTHVQVAEPLFLKNGSDCNKLLQVMLELAPTLGYILSYAQLLRNCNCNLQHKHVAVYLKFK